MEAIAEPEEATRTDAVISLKYPERYGFIRRIVPLWGPYYRVNFIDRETGSIPRSHFIRVKGKKIQEMPE